MRSVGSRKKGCESRGFIPWNILTYEAPLFSFQGFLREKQEIFSLEMLLVMCPCFCLKRFFLILVVIDTGFRIFKWRQLFPLFGRWKPCLKAMSLKTSFCYWWVTGCGYPTNSQACSAAWNFTFLKPEKYVNMCTTICSWKKAACYVKPFWVPGEKNGRPKS